MRTATARVAAARVAAARARAARVQAVVETEAARWGARAAAMVG